MTDLHKISKWVSPEEAALRRKRMSWPQCILFSLFCGCVGGFVLAGTLGLPFLPVAGVLAFIVGAIFAPETPDDPNRI